VLDLVWFDAAFGSGAPLQVRMADRHNSDHAVLAWDMVVDAEPECRLGIPRAGKAASKLARSLTCTRDAQTALRLRIHHHIPRQNSVITVVTVGHAHLQRGARPEGRIKPDQV